MNKKKFILVACLIALVVMVGVLVFIPVKAQPAIMTIVVVTDVVGTLVFLSRPVVRKEKGK